jgi:N-methylhydantoinase A
VWFGGRAQPTPVYARDRLPVGARLVGPAVIDEFGATTVIFPGWRAELDDPGNLVMEPTG